jgi:hypothetical protein
MEKFTVVAKMRFEIEDVDLAHAYRQALASIAVAQGKSNPNPDEYPYLNAPYVIAGDFEILDEDGKVVQKSTYQEDEAEKAE